ncbi:MAG: transketolase [Chloroflexi bacterium]|nr:transketolase [Chloroflexota bacterium]
MHSDALIEQLTEFARVVRRDIVTMTTEAGSGHPSSSLSAVEVLTALYAGDIMRHNSAEPQWPERDRFILSKGHAAPVLYAVLAERGYFPKGWLMTLRKMDSLLEGHPNMCKLAGVEASTGSLGQGLSIGIGHALAARLDHRDYRTYVMIGDGESDEGQVWEAAMTAAKYKLNNLTCIVDRNGFQQTAPTQVVMPSLDPLAEKWRAFGWHIAEINGHALAEVLSALNQAMTVTDQPQVIIAHTVKGYGVSYLANDTTHNHFHGVPLTRPQAEAALKELE